MNNFETHSFIRFLLRHYQTSAVCCLEQMGLQSPKQRQPWKRPAPPATALSSKLVPLAMRYDRPGAVEASSGARTVAASYFAPPVIK